MDWSALGFAAGLCAAMIVAEATLSGNELQRWLASLKRPRLYLPLWAWILAALATYAIQGVVAYRLFRSPANLASISALALLAALMSANVAYNIVLDRRRDPRIAYLGVVWFLPLLIALQGALFLADTLAAMLHLIYVAWVLFYDLPIMRELWKLNAPPRP